MEPSKETVLDHVASVFSRMYTSNTKVNMNACQFSCQRKALIEECMVMLKRRSPTTHKIFLSIVNSRGFRVEMHGRGTCAISNRDLDVLRRIILTDSDHTDDYVVRSDMVPIIQSFYAFVHWESFVTLQLYDRDLTEQSAEWKDKIWQTYLEHYKMVKAITTALHHKYSIY